MRSCLEVAADVATVIGVIGVIGAVPALWFGYKSMRAAVVGVEATAQGVQLAAKQMELARLTAQGDFLLRLDERLKEHTDLHHRLKRGRWGTQEPSSTEFNELVPYLGLFERIKVLVDTELIDLDPFDRLYGYRLDVLWWNKGLHNLLRRRESGWKDYLALQAEIDALHAKGGGRGRRREVGDDPEENPTSN